MTAFHRTLRHSLRAFAATIAGTAFITMTPAIATGLDVQNRPQPSETESVAVSISQLPETEFCAADLGTAINAIVNRPQFATASWGIAIQPLSEAEAIYENGSEKSLIPASNIKLLTTAAALKIILDRNPQALPTFQAQIEVINRYSHNARADELLKAIGGQNAVRTALTPLGISPEGYQQVDGSGLSRSNRAKPSTLVALLKAMHHSDDSRLFYYSLPVGGINGTLRNRFKDTPAQGKVRAKTGTLNGVRALSGYLETEDYGTVMFSIVVNQPGQSGSVMLRAIDEMVLYMSQVQPCD